MIRPAKIKAWGRGPSLGRKRRCLINTRREGDWLIRSRGQEHNQVFESKARALLFLLPHTNRFQLCTPGHETLG
jgi:hypothetical protein